VSSRVADEYFVREWFSSVSETTSIRSVPLEVPLVKAAVGVVLRNPLAGLPFEQDLSGLTGPSHLIGTELGRRAVALLGGRSVEGYGKGALVGLDGEQEHGVACITSVFGDAFREQVGGGKAWISSVSKLAGPGQSIDIPLAYKDEIWVRSHYDAMTLWIPDAPRGDEIVICVAVSSGARPLSRVGGMTVAEANK
jgi:hypothetical protein